MVTANSERIARSALIVLLAAAVVFLGHYGFRFLHRRSDAAEEARIEFGLRAGRNGSDVPMPPRSKAAFTVPSKTGSGRALIEYASQAAPEEILRFYRAEMPRLGWSERPVPPGASAGEDQVLLWYSNAAGGLCIISVSTRPGPETAVTVLRMTSSEKRN